MCFINECFKNKFYRGTDTELAQECLKTYEKPCVKNRSKSLFKKSP